MVAVGGFVYVTGFFSGTEASLGLVSRGVEDVFVAKYSQAGALQWARRFGGTTQDNPGGIAVDASGNVYVAGGFGGTATFGPALCERDARGPGRHFRRCS